MATELVGLVPFVPGGRDFAGSRALFRDLGFDEVRAISLLVVTTAATGCSDAVMCPPCFAYGLAVSVVNDLTGQPICDAAVTARDGGYLETLTGSDGGGGCRYIGAPERPGNYAVQAERMGFLSKTLSNVKVVMDSGGDCPHVQPADVVIRLVPAT